VSILFASSPKRPDPKFTDSSRKIAINTGPCPSEEIDTHSPKPSFKFVSLLFPLKSTDELKLQKRINIYFFITEDFNTSLFEKKRKNINWEREDITSVKEEF